MKNPPTGAPIVSVMIPTHNRPALLAEAIRSVLDDGFQDFELIVSDNSDVSGAEAIVAGFHDPRIVYIRGPVGGGPFANWHSASIHAAGIYCFKLDDDDRILPGFLSAATSFLDSHESVASVYPAFATVDDRVGTVTPTIDTDFFHGRNVVSGSQYALGVLVNEGGYPRNHKNTPFYRRSAGEAIGFYADAPEDFAFGVALATQGDVGYIPEVFYLWRIHGQASTHDLFPVWKGTVHALNCMAASRRIQSPRGLESRWQSLLQQSRQRAHLFYLHAALRQQGRWSAWRLWLRMRRGATHEMLGLRTTLLLAMSFVLPLRFHRNLIMMYQRSHWMQGVVKTLLGG